jgi:DNA polymerase (family X)
MPSSNVDIAKVFDEIADLLEIQDGNPFRVRAYRNAARTVEGLGDSIGEMIAKGENVTELPGIGKELAAKIREILDTGTCAALEELRQQLPPTITTLLRIPGLGPKRVQALYRNLDISTPEQLYAAVLEGKVRALAGFGEKTESTIRQALSKDMQSERISLARATEDAEPLRAYLAQTPGVTNVVIAGSYRRSRETVADLDIVVTAKKSGAVMDRFCGYEKVSMVKGRGDTRATVVLASGLQVDLRVVPQASFGAALYYFTGSKAHNVAVRRIAQMRGLKINEYGVYRGRRRIAGDTEESVFASIGLPYIAPELRENRGEIEAAQADKLPALIAPEDLQGDLNVSVSPSDTHNLRAWVGAARERRLHYLALAIDASGNHNEIDAWIETVDRLNDKLGDFVLFKALQTRIRVDGTLEAPRHMLDRFDIVIGGIESDFAFARAKQTERILRAFDEPHFTMLAHPTGRLINRRPSCELDLPRIVRAAHERKILLELDARPNRLDLPDVYCRLAKDEDVPIAIDSNARNPEEFVHLSQGVRYARRGWLEAKNVANAQPLGTLRKLLKSTRA